MAKRRMSCSTGETDRLSVLPDEILINNILCLLPMEEAQRSSIFAKRWRFLWTRLPVLDFDGFQVVRDIWRLHNLYESPEYSFFYKVSQAGSKYVAAVSKAIAVCCRSRTSCLANTTILRRFRICFPLNGSFSDEIDSWLQFSLERGVEMLDLNFFIEEIDGGPLYAFPSFSHRQFPKFRLLKSLCLRLVDLSNDTLRGLLLGCESLERLQLYYIGESLTEMRVTGPVSRLKYIDIDGCSFLKSVVITAPTPDLVSFAYWGQSKALHIEHAPRLVDMRIHVDNFLSHPLLRYIPQLESLHLSTDRWDKVRSWLPRFPDLSGLKHLRLELRFYYAGNPKFLKGVASLIRAAPQIQHLTLEVPLVGTKKLHLTDQFEGLRLRCLRVVEIAGYNGGKHFLLAKRLINDVVSPSLEKFIIDFKNPLMPGPVCANAADLEKLEKQKSKALKLKRALPPRVELVVMISI